MVYSTPELRRKRQKLALELEYLKMKEKFFGRLSDKDEKRRKEILLFLGIFY